MQIVSLGGNMHAITKPIVWETMENISKCRLLIFFQHDDALKP